jgi:hypothetical protein
MSTPPIQAWEARKGSAADAAAWPLTGGLVVGERIARWEGDVAGLLARKRSWLDEFQVPPTASTLITIPASRAGSASHPRHGLPQDSLIVTHSAGMMD